MVRAKLAENAKSREEQQNLNREYTSMNRDDQPHSMLVQFFA